MLDFEHLDGISISSGTVVCFSIYAGLIVCLISSKWLSDIRVSISLLLILILSALFYGLLKPTALPLIVSLFLSGFVFSCTENIVRKIALLSLSVLAVAFSLHLIPGFNNELIFSTPSFGASKLPFKLYANLDKALAGVALILAMRGTIKWRITGEELYLIIASIGFFFGISIILGAPFEPKVGELTLAFIFFNLLVTCLAEEAFFRLVVQNGLTQLSKGFLSGWFAVLITAILFMLAHFHTGVGAEKRLFLIFLAGFLYGAVYLKKKSLGSAVAIHFGINVIHFSFFSYPATFH